MALTSCLSPTIIVSEHISIIIVFGFILMLLIVAYCVDVTVPLTFDFSLLKSCGLTLTVINHKQYIVFCA